MAAEVPESQSSSQDINQAFPDPTPVTENHFHGADSESPAQLTALALAGKLSVVDLSPLVKQRIAHVRSCVNSTDASLVPTHEMGGDARIMRFLIANKWDSEKAAAEYKRALQIRSDKGIDVLRTQIIASNDAFFKGGAHLDKVFLHAHSSSLHTAQPRTFTTPLTSEMDCPHRLLLDRKGNIAIYEAPGRVDYAALHKLGKDEWEREFFTCMEMRMLILDELSRRSGVLKLTCTVLDMSGVSLVNALAPAYEKAVKGWAKSAGSDASSLYPTTTYRTYLINIPDRLAKMAGPAIKSFAPSRSANKLKILGTDYHSALATDLKADQLLRRYGGTVLDEP